ncbi:MAG: hypothetical protein K0V04_35085 [Deltaproteobacteria bacterium]|nr:hypothetical protein [Deltaproteobacteria bacterium]
MRSLLRARAMSYAVLGACIASAACGDGGSVDDTAANPGSSDDGSSTGGPDASTTTGGPGTTDDGLDVETGADGSGTTDTDGSSSTGSELPPVCIPEAFPPTSVEDDGYQRFELCGWTVYMRIELFELPLGHDVYDALAEDLIMSIEVLPEPAVELLQDTNLWMELDVPQFPGAVYHPSAQWLEDNGYPTKWAEGVQFGNAENYMNWVAQQPAMVVHELTHAWDHRQFGYAHPEVLAAYEAAMAAGLYDAVEYVDGQILEAYATNNAAEYFAEISEAYFWSNDFYPFVRAELERHDPVGYAAVEQAWGIRAAGG